MSTVSTGFQCKICGKHFTLADHVREKYPNWIPQKCWKCSKADSAKSSGQPPPENSFQQPASINLTQEVPYDELQTLEREITESYYKGPNTGVFTDGACLGNPGPGGWATVRVNNNKIIDQRFGYEPHTTNNRMELKALIAGYQLVACDETLIMYSDSRLCVDTINVWAESWKRRGWKRKDGPVKNLELVQELYELSLAHPRVKLTWIKAHDGSRWNEYVDRLSMLRLPVENK